MLSNALLWAGRVGGYTAAQVEEVRMVMRMLPVFFTTILFWTIYCQASRANNKSTPLLSRLFWLHVSVRCIHCCIAHPVALQGHAFGATRKHQKVWMCQTFMSHIASFTPSASIMVFRYFG